MKKHHRPFEYFLAQLDNYVDMLRAKYALREARNEPIVMQFALGQFDALDYVVRLGYSIFYERLAEPLPDIRELSEAECEALALEQEILFKSLNKKRG